MAKNQTTTVFCIHCSFKTFPPFIIYVLSESFLQFIFYNTCSLFMQLLCRSILYQSCLICQISFLSCFWKIYFYDIAEYLFGFLFYILAFGNQILYNRNIRNLLYSIINHIVGLQVFLYTLCYRFANNIIRIHYNQKEGQDEVNPYRRLASWKKY